MSKMQVQSLIIKVIVPDQLIEHFQCHLHYSSRLGNFGQLFLQSI